MPRMHCMITKYSKVTVQTSLHQLLHIMVLQVRAVIQILKHFAWTWVGLLVSDDDYGLHVARSFQSDFAQSSEGCLAYTEILPWGNNRNKYSNIVGVIKGSSAKVVIVFAHQMHMIQLMTEVCQNLII